MSGSRFPWLPVLVLAAVTAWAAGGSGAAPSRDVDGGWGAPMLLAQVAPDGGAEAGGDEGEDQEQDPQDTLGVDEGEPLTPDTTQVAPPPSASPSAQPADTSLSVPARADTTIGTAAPSDTSRAAGADTLRGTATPDSARASALRRAAAVADTADADTLFLPKPRPQPAKPVPSPAPVKKPRTGILGIHPIVILLGAAVLHYMVVKTTGD